MKKRKGMNGLELILLHCPMTLALAILIPQPDHNNNEVLIKFLLLCYFYWLFILIYYTKTVEDFIIIPSSLWRKTLLFLVFPLVWTALNIAFMAIAISLVEWPLKIFGLKEW